MKNKEEELLREEAVAFLDGLHHCFLHARAVAVGLVAKVGNGNLARTVWQPSEPVPRPGPLWHSLGRR